MKSNRMPLIKLMRKGSGSSVKTSLVKGSNIRKRKLRLSPMANVKYQLEQLNVKKDFSVERRELFRRMDS